MGTMVFSHSTPLAKYKASDAIMNSEDGTAQLNLVVCKLLQALGEQESTVLPAEASQSPAISFPGAHKLRRILEANRKPPKRSPESERHMG